MTSIVSHVPINHWNSQTLLCFALKMLKNRIKFHLDMKNSSHNNKDPTESATEIIFFAVKNSCVNKFYITEEMCKFCGQFSRELVLLRRINDVFIYDTTGTAFMLQLPEKGRKLFRRNFRSLSEKFVNLCQTYRLNPNWWLTVDAFTSENPRDCCLIRGRRLKSRSAINA